MTTIENIKEKIKLAKLEAEKTPVEENEFNGVNIEIPRWWNFLKLTDEEDEIFMHPCFDDEDEESKLEEMLDYFEEKEGR